MRFVVFWGNVAFLGLAAAIVILGSSGWRMGMSSHRGRKTALGMRGFGISASVCTTGRHLLLREIEL
jgi:hypothetical protein